MTKSTLVASSAFLGGALLGMNQSSDPYEGTTYRHLTNAEESVGLARFHGSADGIGCDSAEAVRQIDAAVAALLAARALFAAEVTA